MGIIIKPIVTEKQTAITEKMDNRYGFRVSPDANKLEIRKAIEDMYNVTVVERDFSGVLAVILSNAPITLCLCPGVVGFNLRIPISFFRYY